MVNFFTFSTAILLFCTQPLFCKGVNDSLNKVQVYSNPKGELLSSAYTVFASGIPVPVYPVKVGAADDSRRFKAVDDLMHSEVYFDTAAFCYFDVAGLAKVRVTVQGGVKSFKILPSSANIKGKIIKGTLSFSVSSPKNLTVEINGQTIKSLHVFINAIEKDKPKANDPDVIYFGPGIHEVSNLIVGDNKTVYIAGGAVIRTVIGQNEKFGIEPSGLKNYQPSFILAGKNIRFRGRGILDASAVPTHAKNFMFVKGSDIKIEGVIFKNSSSWAVPLRQCNHVMIDNIKILGYRANSDGIDICNSSNVTVKNCFIRTNDDLIVIKTWEKQGVAEHIVVKKCVLWNQLAHALSIGAELRENVDDVLFTNCDIIHDKGREWSLRVFQGNAALVSNVRFENLNIEESHKFASLWIGKVSNSADTALGHIRNISFTNIKVAGNPLTIEVLGGSKSHLVEHVLFKNILLNGKKVVPASIRSNVFVKYINIFP